MIPRFRAWDRTTKKTRACYGFNKMEQEVYVCSLAEDEFNGQIRTSHAITRSFDDVILMQSTGLFDKNLEEIFEGDIVKLKPHVYGDYEYAKVTKPTGRNHRVTGYNWSFELWLRADDVEIVGNIHENPELLEEVD